MKFISQAVFAAAVLAAPAAFAMPVNLITNGSFEVTSPTSPTTGLVNGATYANMPTTGASWDVFNALPGWTAGVGDAGIEAQTARTLTGPNTVDPFDGEYYVELDSDNDYKAIYGIGPAGSNSSMSQTVSNLSAGDYQLSFAYSPRTNPNTDSKIGFTFDTLFSGTVSSSLNILTGATTSALLDPTPATIGTWSIATVLFNIATDGDYTLTFSALGTDNELGGFIDDVRLSAVPLPAPALLLFGALASFGMLRRYRTA